MTKNRIGNALAVLAAAVGLVLVFSGAGHGDSDDAPSAPPASSQVAPPAPGQVTAPAPAPGTSPGAGQAPAPAAPTKDGDGDDDG